MAGQLFLERDCVKCTDMQKKEWGCEGKAILPVFIDGEPEYTCIRRPILDNPRWFNEIFTMYSMYKNGFLPYEGTYMAQPLSFLQAINVIDATLEECDKIEEQDRQRKSRNKRRSGVK